jgi:hypothetical protein
MEINGWKLSEELYKIIMKEDFSLLSEIKVCYSHLYQGYILCLLMKKKYNIIIKKYINYYSIS